MARYLSSRALVALTLVLMLILAACGGQPTAQEPTAAPAPDATEAPAPAPDATEAPAPPASGEAETITIWHQWDGTYLESIEQAFRDYEAANPGVTIDLSRPDDVNNALQVAIPAGEGPDIIGWANDQIGQSALVGNIVALDDYGITMDFLNSTYEPAAVNGVVWQERIWGLPESQEGIALIYNKELVDEANLPSDLPGLLAAAQEFRAANPDKAYVCNQGFGAADAYHVAPIYFGFGVPTFVDDTGTVFVNTPEMIAGGEYLAELAQVSFTENTYDICQASLAEGRAAMWWTGPWAVASVEADGVDYGILPMGSPFVGIKTLLLTKNAVDRGNTDRALDIMRYFTSADVQLQLALVNKTIPAATEALNNPEVQALASLAGFGESLNSGVPMANTPFASAQWQPVGDASVAIWNGTQPPAEALEAAADAVEQAIGQMQ